MPPGPPLKVLLAYRCHDEGVGDAAASTLPAGLLWIAAALHAAGHDPTVANLAPLGWKDVDRFVKEQAPDVVGIVFLTANRRASSRLVRLARRARPEALIVAGGAFATALAEPLLRRVRELDAVVLGEGEAPMVAACNALGSGGRGN